MKMSLDRLLAQSEIALGKERRRELQRRAGLRQQDVFIKDGESRMLVSKLTIIARAFHRA